MLNVTAMVYDERLMLKEISTTRRKTLLHCKDRIIICEIEAKESIDPR